MFLSLGDDTITFSAALLVGLDCLTNNHFASSERTIPLLGDFFVCWFRWFEAYISCLSHLYGKSMNCHPLVQDPTL